MRNSNNGFKELREIHPAVAAVESGAAAGAACRRLRWQLQRGRTKARCTAGAPVAALEQDVQGCRLNFLVHKLALSAPIDEIHLDNALAAADSPRFLLRAHISQVADGLLPGQRVAAEAAVVSVNGSNPAVVLAQLAVNPLEATDGIIFCFQNVPDSLLRNSAEQFFEFPELPTFMNFVHHR
jgi:hypothetical protein